METTIYNTNHQGLIKKTKSRGRLWKIGLILSCLFLLGSPNVNAQITATATGSNSNGLAATNVSTVQSCGTGSIFSFKTGASDWGGSRPIGGITIKDNGTDIKDGNEGWTVNLNSIFSATTRPGSVGTMYEISTNPSTHENKTFWVTAINKVLTFYTAEPTVCGTDPEITVTCPGTTTFNTSVGAAATTVQSFTVGGKNLGAATNSVSITTSRTDLFEVSTTSATGGFGATATLTPTSTGAITGTNNVWVRLKANIPSAITVTGVTITASSSSVTATDTECSLSATVTQPVISVTTTPTGTIYAAPGENVTLTANPTSSGALSYTYQWKKGGTNITTNGTGQSYNLNNQTDPTGNYTVTVSATDYTDGTSAAINVLPRTVSLASTPGCGAGTTVTVTPVNGAAANYSYQWVEGAAGTPASGWSNATTGTNLTTATATLDPNEMGRSYAVKITITGGGTFYSDPIQVQANPSIPAGTTATLVSQSILPVCTGGSAVLVAALVPGSGTLPSGNYTVVWTVNGVVQAPEVAVLTNANNTVTKTVSATLASTPVSVTFKGCDALNEATASITVTSKSCNARYVNQNALPDGGTTRDGMSWETAYADIQTALANITTTSTNPGTIYVAAGTYTPASNDGYTLKSYLTIQGGYASGVTTATEEWNPTSPNYTGYSTIIRPSAAGGRIFEYIDGNNGRNTLIDIKLWGLEFSGAADVTYTQDGLIFYAYNTSANNRKSTFELGKCYIHDFVQNGSYLFYINNGPSIGLTINNSVIYNNKDNSALFRLTSTYNTDPPVIKIYNSTIAGNKYTDNNNNGSILFVENNNFTFEVYNSTFMDNGRSDGTRSTTEIIKVNNSTSPVTNQKLYFYNSTLAGNYYRGNGDWKFENCIVESAIANATNFARTNTYVQQDINGTTANNGTTAFKALFQNSAALQGCGFIQVLKPLSTSTGTTPKIADNNSAIFVAGITDKDACGTPRVTTSSTLGAYELADAAPVVITGLASDASTYCAGDTITLSANVTGGVHATNTYKWYLGTTGATLAGPNSSGTGTSATMTYGYRVPYGTTGNLVFRLVVQDVANGRPAVDSILRPAITQSSSCPAITIDTSADLLFCERAGITLTANLGNMTTGYTLQWFKGTNSIAGKNDISYSIMNGTSADNGTYVLKAYNAAGYLIAESNAITLTARPTTPVVNITGLETSYCPGATVSLSTDDNTFASYAWAKNRKSEIGVGNPYSYSYTLPSEVDVAYTDTVSVTVKDVCNSEITKTVYVNIKTNEDADCCITSEVEVINIDFGAEANLTSLDDIADCPDCKYLSAGFNYDNNGGAGYIITNGSTENLGNTGTYSVNLGTTEKNRFLLVNSYNTGGEITAFIIKDTNVIDSVKYTISMKARAVNSDESGSSDLLFGGNILKSSTGVAAWSYPDWGINPVPVTVTGAVLKKGVTFKLSGNNRKAIIFDDIMVTAELCKPTVKLRSEDNGCTVKLYTIASGEGLTYTWYRNDILIDSTGNKLTLTKEDGAAYKVVITDAYRRTATSKELTISAFDYTTPTLTLLPVGPAGDPVFCYERPETKLELQAMNSVNRTDSLKHIKYYKGSTAAEDSLIGNTDDPTNWIGAKTKLNLAQEIHWLGESITYSVTAEICGTPLKTSYTFTPSTEDCDPVVSLSDSVIPVCEGVATPSFVWHPEVKAAILEAGNVSYEWRKAGDIDYNAENIRITRDGNYDILLTIGEGIRITDKPFHLYVRSNLLWKGGTSNWSDKNNWVYCDSTGVTYTNDAPMYLANDTFPTACYNVFIDSIDAVTSYPSLTQEVACNNIHFFPDASIGGIHYLKYKRASVELKLASNTWYMLSPVLDGMLSGDYAPNTVLSYIRYFSLIDDGNGGFKGNWTKSVPGTGFSLASDIGGFIFKSSNRRPTSEYELQNVKLVFPPAGSPESKYHFIADEEKAGSVKDQFTIEIDLSSRIDTGSIFAKSSDIEHPEDEEDDVYYIAIGNPYMSHLNMVEFCNENGITGPDVKRYKASASGKSGGFDPLYSFEDEEDVPVAPHQAFLVPITLKDINKETKKIEITFKSSTMGESNPSVRLRSNTQPVDRLRMNASIGGITSLDAQVVAKPGYSNQYLVKEDAVKVFTDESVIDIYTLAGGKKPSDLNKIDAEALDGLMVPININTKQTGVLTLEINGAVGFTSADNIWLIDSVANTKTSLLDRNVFEINKETKDNVINRFYLLFDQKNPGEIPIANDVKDVEGSGKIFVGCINRNVVVQSRDEQINTVIVYDVAGREVYLGSNLNTTDFEHSLPGMSSYIVKVITDKQVVTEKVFIK